MASSKDRLSLNSRSLNQKLIVAFELMSILPLLVCVYLVSTYILPKFGMRLDIVASILTSILVAVVGFLVIKDIFDRLTSVTSEAKKIAAGDISLEVSVEHDDEVSDLGIVVNQLTQRIRGNMEELKNYSVKTNAINLEIQRRVVVLSNLMQISALITNGSKFDDILKIAVEKSRLLANSDSAFLFFRDEAQDSFYVKIADGANADYLSTLVVKHDDELYLKALNVNKFLLLDKQNFLNDNLTVAFYERFHLKNALTMPVFLKGKIKAVLGIGNTRESFQYTKDDIELLDIFAKQIAIAIENDILSHRVEKLEVKDALTGLFNTSYIHNRLQEEIKRAINYQRPCSFIIFDIDNFKQFHQNFGLIAAEGAIKNIASLISKSLDEIARVGRTGDDEFAVVLPECNKRQAYEAAEEIRKKVEAAYNAQTEQGKKITVSAGVSENPLDGVEAQQLIAKAKELLNSAKRLGRNRVAAF
ncbi:MAG: diguanylate cyclase [Candidatus Omnitrophota bacterium]|jgi:diguanylate cyclase (GGDEF)-like protein